ncbi:MAG: hypothetical protein EZS28_006579, partial [Streblomastix strix]
MIICLSHQQFDVSGDTFYVSTTGVDNNGCQSQNHCQTLDSETLQMMVEYSYEYTLYIMDETSISSTFEISPTQSLPRKFTNNPIIGGLNNILINENGQFHITGSALFEMIKFTMLGQASLQNGGFINANLTSSSSNLQFVFCIFDQCKAIDNGGALSLVTFTKTDTTLRDMSFQHCESQNEGGAFQCSINNGAKLTIAGLLTFQDCKTLSDSGYGGALYAKINGENSQLIFKYSVTFERCSGQSGGGMRLIVQNKGNFTINGQCNFTNCSSSNIGGGIYLETNNGTVNFNQTEQILIENCSCDGYGGGIYCSISNNGQIQINNIKLRNCKSQRSGGGIYAIINDGGQLILDKSCEFNQCESHGNGGGIYVQINLTEQFSFLIKDASIHECKSVTNTSLSYSQTGFGGGLFFGCNGDYDPSTELIDLRGMKIYNNSADKYGCSLFIVMKQVIEFCKQGFLGEYVKGNYSDAYSDEHDLVGIPVDFSTFNSSSPQTIE